MAESRAMRLGLVSDIYIETLPLNPAVSAIGRIYGIEGGVSLHYVGSKGLVTFATTHDLSAYEKRLGYTAENIDNKKVDFSDIDNASYPTTEAIVDYTEPLFEMKENMDEIVAPFLLSVLGHIENVDLHVSSFDKDNWNSKQDALVADTDYLTPTTAVTTYEPKKQATDLYVTQDEKYRWDDKFHVEDILEGLCTKNTRLVPALNEVNAVAKGATIGETFLTIEEMVITLNEASQTAFPYGKNLNIIDVVVPDFWIANIEDSQYFFSYINDDQLISDINNYGYIQIGYYSIGKLDVPKIYLDDVLRDADITGDVASNYDREDLVVSAKGVYDYLQVITEPDFDKQLLFEHVIEFFNFLNNLQQDYYSYGDIINIKASPSYSFWICGFNETFNYVFLMGEYQILQEYINGASYLEVGWYKVALSPVFLQGFVFEGYFNNEVSLANVFGTYYGSEFNVINYNYIEISLIMVVGGCARLYINCDTEPYINSPVPAVKLKGSTFQPYTDMYLHISYDGHRVEYYFAEIEDY